MKAATVRELKQELSHRPPDELVELCLQFSKFKKENKELLTYLLYEASNETAYIENVKREIDNEFGQINISSFYYIKKTARKILRITKKYIRYSKKKETEVALLMYYCSKLIDLDPSIGDSIPLQNLLNRQIVATRKAITYLHEDLQYDYQMELDAMLEAQK